MLKKGMTAVFGAAMLFGSTACASVARMDKIPEPPQEYLDWLDDLKEEMVARGISAETVNRPLLRIITTRNTTLSKKTANRQNLS